MEKIIDPIDVNLIKAELTPEKKLRDTNKGGNEIYIVDWKDSPNTLQERSTKRPTVIAIATVPSAVSSTRSSGLDGRTNTAAATTRSGRIW